MKSFVRSIRLAAAFLLLIGVHQASAQVTGSIEFTTTFPFAVGYANVPAGTYTLRPDDHDPGIFELTGKNVTVLFLTDTIEARERPATSEIVFKRYGNGYVLKDVWMQGSTVGAEAIAAEAEKHAAARGETKSDYRVAALRASQSNRH
jgi:hypothetical protein